MIGISGVAAGVGSTVLLVSYGVSFGQSDLNATLATAALSLVFGAVLYTVVLEIAAFLPWLPFVVAVIIPAAECFCLWLNSSLLIDPLEFAQITLSVRKPTFALRVCLPFLLFGFALGILRTRALNDVPLFENPSVRILFVIGACVTGCVFVICAILTQKQNLNFLLRPLMPFAAVILAWYYFAGIASSLLQSVMFFAGYLVFECATWVYFSDVTQRYRISPFIVFGFGRGALAAGTLISVFISSPFGLNILDRRGVVILIFAALLIAYVLIPQDSTIRDLTIVDGSGHGLDNRGGGAEDNDKKTTHIGWFKYKCNALATRYLLSQRETEVLFLLAKGRNAAYIQERLYISEGTARTHMRHIYKKLNIHTQQELINMVDSMQVDLPPSAPLLP